MADMLVTAAELASHLQQDVDAASAQLAIQNATGVVQAICRQRLVEVVGDVATLPATGSRWLDLPQAPVSAVASVTISAVAVTSWTLTSNPISGRARLWRYWGWRYAAGGGQLWPLTVLPQVVVTYTHGYPAGDPGLELARAAVLALAAGGYRNPDGLRSEAIDDYQVAYADSASRAVLDPVTAAALRRQYGVISGTVNIGSGYA